MKQHITEKQFLELSEKGMDRYRDYFLTDKVPLDKIMYCNIGQMIEFLDDDVSWNRLIILSQHDSDYGMSYRIICFRKEYEKDELCDALWEAVKEVLEK